MIAKFKRTTPDSAIVEGRDINGIIIAHKTNNNNEVRTTETIFGDNRLIFHHDRSQNQRNGLDFIQSLLSSNICLNNDYIGYTLVKKVPKTEATPMKSMFFDNQTVIDVYDIGIGDRFLFFYANGITVGCAHHDNVGQFSIFAEDEWHIQLISTFIADFCLFGQDDFANSYITNDSRVLEKYDGNYISELIQTEDIETRQQYQHLIHSHINKEEVLSTAIKSNKKKTFGLMSFIFIFFTIIILLIASTGYAEYKSIMDSTPYYATNMDLDGSHHAVQGIPGFWDYGLDVSYKDGEETVQKVIYVSKSTYDEYKDKKHFYFRVHETTDEDGDREYEYYIDDPSALSFMNIPAILVISLFGIAIEGLLIFSMRKQKKT